MLAQLAFLFRLLDPAAVVVAVHLADAEALVQRVVRVHAARRPEDDADGHAAGLLVYEDADVVAAWVAALRERQALGARQGAVDFVRVRVDRPLLHYGCPLDLPSSP